MPGSNFDSPLTITGGQITPRGPLDPALTSPPAGTIELYVWVVQEPVAGPGAFMRSRGVPDPLNPTTQWVTPAPGTVASSVGTFRPGSALGMAVQVSTGPGGQARVHWWTEKINLTP